MAGRRFEHTCRCGEVRITVDVPAKSAGGRVVCYCADCQTAARHLGDPEALLAPGGGSDIWQTTPDRLTIEAGMDRLHILRLSDKGLLRWYASCCGTPVLNTLPRVATPFVGVVLRPDEKAAADETFGARAAQVFTASARPGGPRRDEGFARVGYGVLSRMVGAWLSGRGRINPLFDADGHPAAPVRVLSSEERRSARP